MAAAKKGFAALTPKQQERHRNLLASLEIDLEETLGRHISSARARGPVMISTDLHNTVILPKIVVVQDIATMKRYGGIPDQWFDSSGMDDEYVSYPAAEWKQEYNRLIDKAGDHRTLVNTLSPEQRGQIRQAMSAWMLGHSQKVKSYETIINAIHFPQTAAIFVGDTLCVAAGTTVIIGPNQELRAMFPQADQDPYTVVFSNVCVEEGGQIQYQVPTSMTVTGTFTKAPAGGCHCS